MLEICCSLPKQQSAAMIQQVLFVSVLIKIWKFYLNKKKLQQISYKKSVWLLILELKKIMVNGLKKILNIHFFANRNNNKNRHFKKNSNRILCVSRCCCYCENNVLQNRPIFNYSIMSTNIFVSWLCFSAPPPVSVCRTQVFVLLAPIKKQC